MPRKIKYFDGPKVRGVQSDLLKYGKVLERLLHAIRRDIKREVLPLYQEINNGRAHDGLFSGILIAINDLIKKYSEPEEVIKATTAFGEENSDYVFRTYDRFKHQNHLKIEWKPTPSTRKKLDEAISRNVDLIKTIPKRYLESVKKEFSKATAKGWDMQRINQVLTERYDISRRHAFNIAVDQQNKVINDVSNQINIDAGLYLVKWQIRAGVRNHRHSHVMANGTIFDVRKGCKIEGEWIMPGEKIKCHCFSVPVIPTDAQRRSPSIINDAFPTKTFYCRAV